MILSPIRYGKILSEFTYRNIEVIPKSSHGGWVRCLVAKISQVFSNSSSKFYVLGCGILDLSNKGIKKLDKAAVPVTINSRTRNVISLNLSGNCLQRLDNIDMFSELIEVRILYFFMNSFRTLFLNSTCFLQLNASRNQLLRMYHVIRLRQLVKINLSNNHILSIEGLRELKNLKYLNLSHNNIKVLLYFVSLLYL